MIILKTVEFWVLVAFIASIYVVIKYFRASIKDYFDTYIKSFQLKKKEIEDLKESTFQEFLDVKRKLESFSEEEKRVELLIASKKEILQKDFENSKDFIEDHFQKLLKARKNLLERKTKLLIENVSAEIVSKSLQEYFKNTWNEDLNNTYILSKE